MRSRVSMSQADHRRNLLPAGAGSAQGTPATPPPPPGHDEHLSAEEISPLMWLDPVAKRLRQRAATNLGVRRTAGNVAVRPTKLTT